MVFGQIHQQINVNLVTVATSAHIIVVRHALSMEIATVPLAAPDISYIPALVEIA